MMYFPVGSYIADQQLNFIMWLKNENGNIENRLRLSASLLFVVVIM